MRWLRRTERQKRIRRARQTGQQRRVALAGAWVLDKLATVLRAGGDVDGAIQMRQSAARWRSEARRLEMEIALLRIESDEDDA